MTQYSCNDEYVAAQIGCFQYFTGDLYISKYSFLRLFSRLDRHSAELQLCWTGPDTEQNYKNCIRAEEGYCCIQYDVVGYAIDAATCADAANRSVMGHISDSSSSSQSV